LLAVPRFRAYTGKRDSESHQDQAKERVIHLYLCNLNGI
jgi:hypothetical protein